jgi:predicted acylesterase/phospholipase RssA
MLSSKVVGGDKAGNQSRVGLALAGGGPLGVIYQIGALLALDEALEGVDFNNLKVYVGVSAGAANASMLANGFTPAKMCKIFVSNESEAFPLDPGLFLRPAFRLYLQGLKSVPGLFSEAIWSFIRDPDDRSLIAALSKLALAIPPGFLDNEPIAKFLEKIFTSRGRTNDFGRLKRKLFVVAANLDTSEVVKFGARGSQHVPISKAVQASTAVPGLYPPVKIDGHYYIDGGIKKTVHASTALDEGADLLFCINPLVPFNARLAKPNDQRKFKTLVDGGLPVVMSQTFYALIYSRMKIGLAKYTAEYPDRDVILFEPNSGDTVMFFSNVFSFANRRDVCEHAYQTTRHDMLTRKHELAPLLARYGITLREDLLEDKSLHFDSNLSIPPEVEKMGKLQNHVTNKLSDTLDQLSEWIESRQPTTVSADKENSQTMPNDNPINPTTRFNQTAFVANSRH